MGKRRRCTQGDRRQGVRMVRRWIGAMRERKERPEADGKWLRMSKREVHSPRKRQRLFKCATIRSGAVSKRKRHK
ncbi:hypothetical protein L5515_007103 [Caenorhabditis briggsae]|uniref:Uncharacterized protein n=1 Tax=Caenorhabditis briggsae TaxID=6238 RepID=A0AAE9F382_CAEBR|nr:hypothetical protein L5515_007103 [Caenorhabditis briggsae]